MSQPQPTQTTDQPELLEFECPQPLADALRRKAKQHGVSLRELISSLVVTPLEDQL